MAHTLGVSSSDIVTAAEYLRLGGVVGLPTETVYGLAASAFNSEAVSEIFRLKGRPPNNPLIVHIHDFDQVDRLARRIPPSLSKIVDQYWPGPLTVVLEAHPDIPRGHGLTLDWKFRHSGGLKQGVGPGLQI